MRTTTSRITPVLLFTTLLVAQGVAQTVAPTLVKDLEATGGSYPQHFCTRNVTGSPLFFTAKVGGKRDLFRTDGTALGTLRLTTLQDDITSAIGVGPLIYFTTASKKLYKTDGSVNGLIMLKQFARLSDLHGTHLPNKMFFEASLTTNTWELWVTDGTVGGTIVLKQPGNGYLGRISNIGALGGKVYFSGDARDHPSDLSAALFISDGTPAGTHRLIDIPGIDDVTELTVANNKLYFGANRNPTATTPVNSDHEPWISDGTTAGTKCIKDLKPIGGSFCAGFTYWEKTGRTYFKGNRDLVMDDGSKVKLLVPAADICYDLCSSKGKLYFLASVETASGTVYSVRSLNATTLPLGGSTVITDKIEYTLPQTYGAQGEKLIPVFIEADPTTGKLFIQGYSAWMLVCDPSTKVVSFVQPAVAPAPTIPTRSFNYNGFMYFSADYTGQGSELYRVQ